MMVAASDDPRINFRMHTICLVEEEVQDESTEPQPGAPASSTTVLAGEIGFSVGQVYTSLSGWTASRTSDAHGTSQLVLLGLWLQKKGYAFWSMGHCYSPQLEYKRALGHRILPRWDFLRLLRCYRGAFLSVRDCANCGAADPSEPAHKACSRCGIVYYCGRECQEAHWKKKPGGHKMECTGSVPAPSSFLSPISTGESIFAEELLL